MNAADMLLELRDVVDVLCKLSTTPWTSRRPGAVYEYLDRAGVLILYLERSGDRSRYTSALALVEHRFPEVWYAKWASRLRHDLGGNHPREF